MKTYTRAIQDLDDGKLPKWSNMQAPDIGKVGTVWVGGWGGIRVVGGWVGGGCVCVCVCVGGWVVGGGGGHSSCPGPPCCGCPSSAAAPARQLL